MNRLLFACAAAALCFASPASAQQSGFGQPAFSYQTQWETWDFGVPPTEQLWQGPMHGPTPAFIPGGRVITTQELASLIAQPSAPFAVFDALGSGETIPGSLMAPAAAQPGHFEDAIQREFNAYLYQITGGDADFGLVFYCLSPECWMSYNAALRAINLGYRNVNWYRGGIVAWKAAGGLVTRPFDAAGANAPGLAGGWEDDMSAPQYGIGEQGYYAPYVELPGGGGQLPYDAFAGAGVGGGWSPAPSPQYQVGDNPFYAPDDPMTGTNENLLGQFSDTLIWGSPVEGTITGAEQSLDFGSALIDD